MTFRGRYVVLLAVLASLLACPSMASAFPSFKLESRSRVDCGSQQVFQRNFQMVVRGKPIPCSQARRISSGKCRIRFKHRWSCFSFPAPDPFLVWFRSRQMFDKRWTTAVTFERYPCADAEVTSELFSKEPRGFPTFRQLLADDLIRCDLLINADKAAVKAMLGKPSSREKYRSSEYWDYVTGPERDSIFQIDPEYLAVRFGKSDLVKTAFLFQG